MFKFGEILEKIPKKYVGTGKRTNIGEAARLGEIRLGQILKNISKKDSYTGFGQRNPVLPKGITKKQSHYSQELNRYKAKAKERQGTRTDIKEKFPESYKQSRDEAGADFNVSGKYVQQAENIKDESPEIFEVAIC